MGGYLATDLNFHGFLLSKSGFSTLDFPGAVSNVSACSAQLGGGTTAGGINPRGDIVGYYCGDDGNNHGFLLNKGNFSAVDFPGAIFTFTGGITPEGDIVGGYQSADGTYHGFVLSHSNAGGRSAALVAPSQTNERPKVALPENVSSLALRRWYFGRFGARLTQPQ